MPEEQQSRSWTGVTGFRWIVLAGAGVYVASRFMDRFSFWERVVVMASGLVVLGVGATTVVPRLLHARRARRWANEAKSTGRWPLAEPYEVTAESVGAFAGAVGELTIEDGVRFVG